MLLLVPEKQRSPAGGAAHELQARGQFVGDGVSRGGNLQASNADGDIERVAKHQGRRFLQADVGWGVEARCLVGGAGRRTLHGVVAHAPAGEGAPDGGMVLALVEEQRVGGQNAVAGIEETGLAGLQLHALQHQLQGNGVAPGAGPVVDIWLDGAALLVAVRCCKARLTAAAALSAAKAAKAAKSLLDTNLPAWEASRPRWKASACTRLYTGMPRCSCCTYTCSRPSASA